MTKIIFYKNGFVVNGHANFCVNNYDIVCAGISAIFIGALNWFLNVANQDIDFYLVKDAKIQLIIKQQFCEKYKDQLSLIKIQIKSIESNNEYKEFIKVIDKSLDYFIGENNGK